MDVDVAHRAAVLDPARLDDARVAASPFRFLVAEHVLPADAHADLAADFPAYDEAGFFPYRDAECGPSIRALIDALRSPAVADRIGTALAVPALSSHPCLVTVCRHLNRRHGTIHTDSRSKVVTALLYLNAEWPDTSDGCLRFLGNDRDIDSLVAPEVRPLYGTLVAFARADNSFHGHLPFEGERRVIQLAWLTSIEELERKTRRGRWSRAVKSVAGALDRWFGSGRDRNAAHR